MAHLANSTGKLSALGASSWNSFLGLPASIRGPAYAATQRRWQTEMSQRQPKTALFFPGQGKSSGLSARFLRPSALVRIAIDRMLTRWILLVGVQRVGMVNDWLEAFPRTVKPFLESVDETLKVPLSKIIEQGPNSKLTATENAQPAIMATSIMIIRVLEQEFGFKIGDRINVTLGHSLGEFAALVAGGYLREADALKMVRKRGEVFARCSREIHEEVGMVALVCEPDHLPAMVEAIQSFLSQKSEGSKTDSHADTDLAPVQQVLIANVNSKNQVVLSGVVRHINELLTHIRQFGGHDPRAVRLSSDSPFHSPLMAPAATLMRKLLNQPSPTAKGEDVITWPGLMPCISNVSARPFQTKQQLKDLLARQAVETVLWHDSIVYLHQDEKVTRWIGIGPGKVGRNLVGKEVGMKGAVKGGGVWGISDPREIENVLADLDKTQDESWT